MTQLHAGLQTTSGTMIPLQGVDIIGEVYGGHGQLTICQRYKNNETKPVEAVYTFPLPADASLVGFVMTCDGRRLEGVVKEREQAFREYDDAIVAGHGAALLEQERPNVFTASVGNLLPGEETVIEVRYLQRLRADEGALRLMIPTLVAPRYIPGTPQGQRTGDGWADPTDRVPDADRITPRIGTVHYGLTLNVLFDLGVELTIESPSHALTTITEAEQRVRVTFKDTTPVALDRDVVLIARGSIGNFLTAAVTHSAVPSTGQILPDGPGREREPDILALTIVPDLSALAQPVAPQDVVFVIDVSGSMMGASIGEAQAALRLCLRHLREGDRFNIIAFASAHQMFTRQLVPFAQKTLEQADAWVQALVADGGTEMLAPVVEAVKQVPHGLLVLLTDGQVGNEDEILTQVLQQRERTRIYTFGIGTNVSDTLLRDLAKQTGGAVEFIYPGERIDEKVVAQFSRALAPRVTNVTIAFSEELNIGERAPGDLPDLVDGEPWELFATISSRGIGQAEIRGMYQNAPYAVNVPIDHTTRTSRPLLTKFWAAERVRDFEAATVNGRRAERMKERIVDLAVTYGLASRYTSFLVIEERTGARRATGQPETRVIPVNLPAGWAMFERYQLHTTMMNIAHLSNAPSQFASVFASRSGGLIERKQSKVESSPSLMKRLTGSVRRRLRREQIEVGEQLAATEMSTLDPTVELLNRQLASGLWDDKNGSGSPEIRQLRATVGVLVELLRANVTTTHRLYGRQIKKAVEAVIRLVPVVIVQEASLAEVALAAAWLAADSGRLRNDVEAVANHSPTLTTVAGCFSDEQTMREYIERSLPTL